MSTESKSVILLVLFACLILPALDANIIGVAAPTISNDLGEYNLFSWLISGYILTLASFMPLYSKLSDLFGRRFLMGVAIVIFAIGSLVCALASTMTILIVGRCITGMGGSGLTVIPQILVADMFNPAERGKYMASVGSVYVLFSIAGPVLGGAILSGLSWRWLFWINLPITLIAFLLSYFYLTVPFTPKILSWRTIDWIGNIMIFTGTVLLLVALSLGGGEYQWSSSAVIVPLVFSFLCYSFFIYAEKLAGSNAIMPLSMFSSWNFSVCCFLAFVCGTFVGSTLYFPSYFQQSWNDSATISGVRIIPFMFMIVTGAAISGTIISKTGQYSRLPLIGSLIQLAGIVIVACAWSTHIDYWIVGLCLGLIGLGLGIIIPTLNIIMVSSVTKEQIAVATGIALFIRQIGASIGASVVGTVLNISFQNHVEKLLPNAPDLAINQVQFIIDNLGASEYENLYSEAFNSLLWVVVGIGAFQTVVSLAVKQYKLPEIQPETQTVQVLELNNKKENNNETSNSDKITVLNIVPDPDDSMAVQN